MKNLRKQHWVFYIFFSFSLLFILSCGSKTMKKARAFIEVEMYEEAIPILEKEIQEHPINADAHFLLGKAYLNSNKGEKAKVSFNRAIKINNKMRDYLIDEILTMALRDIGNANGIIDYFDKSILNPGDKSILNPEDKRRIAQELIQISKTLDKERQKMSYLRIAIMYLDKDKDEKQIRNIEAELTKNAIKNLLTRYGQAVSLRDKTTMSTMSLEPFSLEFSSWKIKNIEEEKTEFISCIDLDNKELEVAVFSLGGGPIPYIREYKGEVRSIEAIVDFITLSGPREYKVYFKKYLLRDPLLNLNRRGRWIIFKYEYQRE